LSESQPGYHGYQWRDIQVAVFKIGFQRDRVVCDAHDKAEEIGFKVENFFTIGNEMRLKKQVSIEHTIYSNVGHFKSSANCTFSLQT